MLARKWILFVLWLPFAMLAFGQNVPTKSVKPLTQFTNEHLLDRNYSYQTIDSVSKAPEQFLAPFKNYILFQDLGNAGSASRSLIFNTNRSIGFNYGDDPYAVYAKNPLASNYYKTKTPFTDLFYTQGPKELLFLKATHSQNIHPRWNIGVDFQRLTSEGYLLRQYTSHYNVQAFTSYQNKNKRYRLLASATWNRGITEESGGIANDSSYESLTGNNRAVNIRLTDAQNRYKNRTAYLKQYFYFGSPIQTIKEKDTLYDYVPKAHVSHSIEASERVYIFENNGNKDSILTPNQYYDIGSSTFDSTYIRRIKNTAQFASYTPLTSFAIDSVHRFRMIGLSHELVAVSQQSFTRGFQNVILTASAEQSSAKANQFGYKVNASYVLFGYNQGDIIGDVGLSYSFAKIGVEGVAGYYRYKPDYAFQLFKQNQFIWENNFDQTNTLMLGIDFKTNTLKHNAALSYRLYHLDNWVFANTNHVPEQASSKAIVHQLSIQKLFQLGNFYFDHRLIVQQSEASYIRLPDFGGMIRYYFARRLFKVLNLQVGFNLYYNTAYYANAYSPATRMFVLQNNTLVGNYPLIEPFVVGIVKKASLFAKYEHVNQDWIKGGYYYTPHYPISLRGLRFGIRWVFYD